MKRKTSIIAATALTGALALMALTPGAYAHDSNKQQNMRGKGEHGQKMGRSGQKGPGAFIHLICSEKGAERLETALGRVGDKVKLSEDQQALLTELKTVTLAAQTDFADKCTTPTRGEDKDLMDHVKQRQANMTAHVAAMDNVVPALEAFYDSLSDEQKAELKPNRRGGRHGKRGGNDGRHSHGRNHS